MPGQDAAQLAGKGVAVAVVEGEATLGDDLGAGVGIDPDFYCRFFLVEGAGSSLRGSGADLALLAAEQALNIAAVAPQQHDADDAGHYQ